MGGEGQQLLVGSSCRRRLAEMEGEELIFLTNLCERGPKGNSEELDAFLYLCV